LEDFLSSVPIDMTSVENHPDLFSQDDFDSETLNEKLDFAIDFIKRDMPGFFLD